MMDAQEMTEQELRKYSSHIRLTESLLDAVLDTIIECVCGQLMGDCDPTVPHEYQPEHQAEYDLLTKYEEYAGAGAFTDYWPNAVDFLKLECLESTPTGRFINGQWELTGVQVLMGYGGPSVRLYVKEGSADIRVEVTNLGGYASEMVYAPNLAYGLMQSAESMVW